MKLSVRSHMATAVSTTAALVSLALFGCNKDNQTPVAGNTPVVVVSPTSPSPTANTDDDNKLALTHGKQLTTAIAMYQADFDDFYPLKDRWADAIKPYVKMPDSYTSPHHPGIPVAFAYNSALSGVTGASLAAPALVVSIFETSLNVPNPSDNGESWWMGTGGQLNATGFADTHLNLLDKKPDPAAFTPPK